VHYLVTGAAGFIGMHTCLELMARGDRVTGLDNLNNYYRVQLKHDRLAELEKQQQGFQFVRADLADGAAIKQTFEHGRFDRVIHLAAQAGVRYSLVNPQAYVDANLTGFTNILEGCRHYRVEHLVYASSSSVYGGNTQLPFATDQNVDHPVSLYAATKKANELMAHTYSHLFGLPTTGLRFFTVYGPWGRPDMAMWLFTEAILAGKPISVFNYGEMQRDFTYVDDIVEGVVRVADRVPGKDGCVASPASEIGAKNYSLYNIGNQNPEPLLRMIGLLEKALGKTAQKELLPMQPGDVPATYADVAALSADVGFRPNTPLEVGIERFVSWYRDYHGVEG
jgi:UDP-glucuronate 4-epimerase